MALPSTTRTPSKYTETTILDALGVEEDLHLLVRDVGRAVDVDLLLADGQCLQGSVVGIARSLDSLAFFPGRKVQDSCVRVKIPLRLYFFNSFSPRPQAG